MNNKMLFKKQNKVASEARHNPLGISNDMPNRNQKCAPAFSVNVQLFLTAIGLANLDSFDDSDPFCILFERVLAPNPKYDPTGEEKKKRKALLARKNEKKEAAAALAKLNAPAKKTSRCFPTVSARK